MLCLTSVQNSEIKKWNKSVSFQLWKWDHVVGTVQYAGRNSNEEKFGSISSYTVGHSASETSTFDSVVALWTVWCTGVGPETPGSKKTVDSLHPEQCPSVCWHHFNGLSLLPPCFNCCCIWKNKCYVWSFPLAVICIWSEDTEYSKIISVQRKGGMVTTALAF